jgi:predicted AAA+ superfamily ATPase
MAEEFNSVILTRTSPSGRCCRASCRPGARRQRLGGGRLFRVVSCPLHLQPVARPNRVALTLIRGVDRVRDILHENTVRFADGYPANNVLLWGARGMGKSSLVKAVHEDVRAKAASL